MVGRAINRARNLWIIIIGIILLLGMAAAILIFTLQKKTEIPQKGVFVMNMEAGGESCEEHR